MGAKLNLLVDRGEPRDAEFAAAAFHIIFRFALEDIKDLEIDFRLGVGVVIHFHGPGVGLAVFQIELVDGVLGALVEVDGVLIDLGGCGEVIDLANDPAVVRRVEDDHIAGGGGAQADIRRGIGVGAPVPLVAHLAKDPVVHQVVEDFSGGGGVQPEGLAFDKGNFEGRALEVAREDDKVVGVARS